MIVLPLALAAVVSAQTSSATMAGFETTGFWTRQYSIPYSYCMKRLVIESLEVGPGISSAIACPLEKRENRSGETYAICRLPTDKIEPSLTRLRALGRAVFEESRCGDPPSHLELAYKSRRLSEEFRAAELSSTSAPGLTGLYDAQMKALEIIQGRHERAMTPGMEVFVSTGGRCAGAACVQFLDSRWNSSRDWQEERRLSHDGFKPWNRSAYPACFQVRAINVFLEIRPDSPQANVVKQKLGKLGEPYEEPGCTRTGAPTFMVFSRKPLNSVVKASLDLPEIHSWGRNKFREANTKTDDARGPILTKELASVNLDLAPHLRALALAEVERVRDSAARIERLKSGVLVIAHFTGK